MLLFLKFLEICHYICERFVGNPIKNLSCLLFTSWSLKPPSSCILRIRILMMRIRNTALEIGMIDCLTWLNCSDRLNQFLWEVDHLSLHCRNVRLPERQPFDKLIKFLPSQTDERKNDSIFKIKIEKGRTSRKKHFLFPPQCFETRKKQLVLYNKKYHRYLMYVNFKRYR